MSENILCGADAQSVPMEGNENEPCLARLTFIICMLLLFALSLLQCNMMLSKQNLRHMEGVLCSIDLDKQGDGRWKVEWYPVPCKVGSGTFKYYFGGQPNPYWCLAYHCFIALQPYPALALAARPILA